jgi:hypothetical protein
MNIATKSLLALTLTLAPAAVHAQEAQDQDLATLCEQSYGQRHDQYETLKEEARERMKNLSEQYRQIVSDIADRTDPKVLAAIPKDDRFQELLSRANPEEEDKLHLASVYFDSTTKANLKCDAAFDVPQIHSLNITFRVDFDSKYPGLCTLDQIALLDRFIEVYDCIVDVYKYPGTELGHFGKKCAAAKAKVAKIDKRREDYKAKRDKELAEKAATEAHKAERDAEAQAALAELNK